MSTFILSWRVIEKGGKVFSFSDIIAALKGFAVNQSPVISEIVQICKLLYVNPATAATDYFQLHGGSKPGCKQR